MRSLPTFLTPAALALSFVAVLPPVSLACSSTKPSAIAPAPVADAAAGDAGVVPAPGLPEVRNLGGPVLATPRARVLTFAGDPNAARVESLVRGIGATAHWRAVATEYGVGPLAADAPVHLTDAAPATIDSAGVKALLAAQLDGSHALGAPDPSTVYVLVLPASTQVTSSLGAGCKAFGGYHAELAAGAVHVAYAVLPTCDGYLGLSGTDALVANAAHELIEACTDPLTVSSPAYGALDAAHAAWAIAWDAYEVADMCAQEKDAFYTPSDFPFVLPRSWSNAAARAGHDPCVPAAAGTFVTTLAPALDTFAVTIDGKTQEARGIAIDVGKARTVPLALYSDGPAAPWSISVVDTSAWAGGPARLSFELDKSQGNAADQVALTIRVLGRGNYGVEPFLVQSTSNGRVTTTVGLVGF